MAAALPLVIRGKAHRKTQLPFGPFLIVGLIVVTLFGADIIDWYTGLYMHKNRRFTEDAYDILRAMKGGKMPWVHHCRNASRAGGNWWFVL
jgi:hypothetical protein